MMFKPLIDLRICVQCVVALSVLLAALQSDARATLRHRYSFNEGATADASNRMIVDSVSGANGVVLGAGASATANALVLPGGGSGEAAYVDLPNGIISSLTDATFEFWYSMTAPTAWTRVFDFGSTTSPETSGELSGPGGGGEGLDYMFFAPTRGAPGNPDQQRFGFRNNDPLCGNGMACSPGDTGLVQGGEQPMLDPNLVYPLGTVWHGAVVFDSVGGTAAGTASASLYINGELVLSGNSGSQLRHLNDVNNWLGRSNWTGDENLNGTLEEFRIYELALSDAEIERSFMSGPDDVAGADALSLQVDNVTGQAWLVNELGRPIAIEYYEITSAGGALNSNGWTSLDGNTAPTEGWDQSENADSGFLAEYNLLEEPTPMAMDSMTSIGIAFNPEVFGAGNDGDLEFRFGLQGGLLRQGVVSYVDDGGPIFIDGDFDGNGSVGGGDFSLVIGNWGLPVDPLPLGWNGAPPISAVNVGGAEFSAVIGNWGNVAGGGASLASVAVPEPTSVVLLCSVGLAMAMRLRHRRR